MNMAWEPRLIVIACHWCTYAGADLAGSLRYSYPATVHIIRVPCSGRVEPEFIAEALQRGADGVFIGGCHFGDCHYKEGNYKAIRRFKLLKRVLTELGVDPDRVQLEWISGSEGKKFAESMTAFDARIRELGPNPMKGGA
ncbi:MAG: hydrogenase iron-sulfur subunit [Thermodesulfovibrio sp.]|nr:hydrogenase iron-sulfur subunit [Thermodesulfovibrio sp.]MDW7972252.1 hydrogenase iron-sulfur subunit [Thermodesulfovibrio sp.]